MNDPGGPRAPRRAVSVPRTKHTVQREIDDEIAFHVDTRVADLVAQGVSPDAARAEAMREYGDVAQSRAELTRVDRTRLSQDRWRTLLDVARADLRYSLRTLRNEPAFTAAVVIVLALGIGANATMFGVIDRLLLRPPPYVGKPEQLVGVNFVRTVEHDSSVQNYLSYPIYLDARAASTAFSSVAAYEPMSLAIGVGPQAQKVPGMRVSANFFSTLETTPAAGRFFLAEEEGSPTAPDVAVVSEDYARAAYRSSTGALGQSLQLGNSKYLIVGVAPRGFTGVSRERVDVWIPMTADVSATEYQGWVTSRDGYWMLAVARLRSTISRTQATLDATQSLRAGARRDGTAERRIQEQQQRIALISILPREAFANDPDAKVAILLGAVSLLVVVIATANITNLQLARALRRRREVALRVALGVSRTRLVGQLLVESTLLALAGGVAALVVARLGGELVRRVLFTSFEWSASIADVRVLEYTTLLAVAVGLVTGLAPALQARSLDLAAALKEGVREGRSRRSGIRTTLLLVQITLSVVLLVGTGLFVRSLERVDALPIGMEPDRVIVGDLRTTGLGYTTPQIHALYDRLALDAQRLPDVEAAALATSLPFSSSWGTKVSIPGRDSVPRVRDGGPYFNGVTADYFRAMGMRLLRGRGIALADRAGTHRVAVINESIARLWWPGEDAIGRCMKVGGDTMPCTEVVGIVANPRRQALIEDESLQFFLPIDQVPVWVKDRVFVVRPRGRPAALVSALHRQLQAAEPGLPYLDLIPMEDLVSPESRPWRLGATMFAAFGALALVLAAVGLYAMLTYDVAQRLHEIGVRVALGARTSDVMRTVMGAGLRLTVVGLVAGTLVTLLAGRLVEPLLFQTSAHEPDVLASVVAVLMGVATIAMLVPTWRAVRIDPIRALRTD